MSAPLPPSSHRKNLRVAGLLAGVITALVAGTGLIIWLVVHYTQAPRADDTPPSFPPRAGTAPAGKPATAKVLAAVRAELGARTDDQTPDPHGTVDGIVYTPDGKPQRGAYVCAVETGGHSKAGSSGGEDRLHTNTDSEGRFHLEGLLKNETVVQAFYRGYAPLYKTRTGATQPMEFRLVESQNLDLTVLDPAGKPVDGLLVVVQIPNGTDWSKKTKAGKVSLRNAPTGLLTVNITPKPNQPFAAIHQTLDLSTGAITIHLKAPLKITGDVVDGVSLQPVSPYRLTYGTLAAGASNVTWQTASARRITTSHYETPIPEYAERVQLKVEADGYAPAISVATNWTDQPVILDFSLKAARDEAAR